MLTSIPLVVVLVTFVNIAISIDRSEAHSTTYVDKSNPYKKGSLTNDSIVLETSSGAPLHTTVLYPTENGTYPVVYFIPGAPDGVIPAEWYTDVLTRVVAHGFIVAAVDAFWPALKVSFHLGQSKIPDKHTQHLQWLRDNLATRIRHDVIPAWDRVGLLCHSAGCDITLRMLQKNASLANSTVFMEPFSVSIKKMPGIKVPAYMYGTQLSEQYGPFPCSLPGVDYVTFYNTWGSPKWMTEVADFGHCDVLDWFAWESCHIGHFCKTVGNWTRVYPVYHEYASGAVSAFYVATLQGYTPSIQYIQEPSLSPLTLLRHNYSTTGY